MDQQPVIPINIILASNSPRRKQLLQDAGVPVRVFTPTEPVDETLDACPLYRRSMRRQRP